MLLILILIPLLCFEQVSELLKSHISGTGILLDDANANPSSTQSSLLTTTESLGGGKSCNNSFQVSGDPYVEFKSLQYSLFITSFVEVVGGLFFLMTAWHIISDKMKADKAISGKKLLPIAKCLTFNLCTPDAIFFREIPSRYRCSLPHF